MNYIKTATSNFQEIEKFGNKYIISIFPYLDNDLIMCTQCSINHYPTLEEIEEIKLDYTNKFIDDYKLELKNKIEEYDKSGNVNICYYQNNPIWLSLKLRLNARIAVNAYLSNDVPTVTYFLNDLKFVLNTVIFANMLKDLEIYAQLCYVVTADHLLAVNKLTTIEDILNYDYKQGYPDKLYFS